MKASEFKHGVGRDGVEFDELVEWLESAEAEAFLKELDDQWNEFMRAGEKFSFIVSAYGGVATVATHAAMREQQGLPGVAARLRMCDAEIPVGDKR